MDYDMPVLNGVQAAKAIFEMMMPVERRHTLFSSRNSCEDDSELLRDKGCDSSSSFELTKGLVILGLTGDAFGQVRRDCLLAGMSEVLQKPISKQVLQRVMHMYYAPLNT